ncbi:hypothetical protein [Kushneria aurantia]|uniref:Uncharacterized protein n=1 Tax=Kushneria aurantia TaxID=504092 RepID=A0ABV6G2V8_9GAMM|nr:hypothetical protein [Kushneria aurantia]
MVYPDGRIRETLNKSTSEMKRKAHGTQNTRHNMGLGEYSSTTQRSDSLAQAFMQRFLSRVSCRTGSACPDATQQPDRLCGARRRSCEASPPAAFVKRRWVIEALIADRYSVTPQAGHLIVNFGLFSGILAK